MSEATKIQLETQKMLYEMNRQLNARLDDSKDRREKDQIDSSSRTMTGELNEKMVEVVSDLNSQLFQEVMTEVNKVKEKMEKDLEDVKNLGFSEKSSINAQGTAS